MLTLLCSKLSGWFYEVYIAAISKNGKRVEEVSYQLYHVFSTIAIARVLKSENGREFYNVVTV